MQSRVEIIQKYKRTIKKKPRNMNQTTLSYSKVAVQKGEKNGTTEAFLFIINRGMDGRM